MTASKKASRVESTKQRERRDAEILKECLALVGPNETVLIGKRRKELNKRQDVEGVGQPGGTNMGEHG